MINKNTKREYYLLFFIEFLVVLILSVLIFLFVLKSYPSLFFPGYEIFSTCNLPGSLTLNLAGICVQSINTNRYAVIGVVAIISLLIGVLIALLNYYFLSKRNPKLLKTSLVIALISFFILSIFITLVLYLDLIS